MVKQMLSLQEAAFLSRRSAQTIRRLIKGNKVKYRKRKTPQGFNYYVDKNSLLDYFDLTPRVLPEEPVEEVHYEEESATEENKSVFNARISPSSKEESTTVYSLGSQVGEAREHNPSALINRNMQDTISLQTKQLEKFADTITKLVGQHQDDKKNLFAIIQNYEQKVKNLENQVQQLSAPSRKWYEFWK